MRPIKIIKCVGSWGFAIAGTSILVIGHSLPVIPEVCGILSIAFALAPESW